MTEAENTIRQREREIVEEFSLFDDWMGRYEYLIDMGKSLPPLPEEDHVDEYKIQGCQSQVWIKPEKRNGTIHFEGDSDALITRGLVALLIRVVDAQPPEAIADADFGFLEEIGMQDHLSPTRKNGLASMVRQMKLYGLAYASSDTK
ncbi:MAG: SufE family protein [Bacteroidota bacterium]